ncbi:type I restriction-modification system subunit M [Acidithiobacillus thiooxidans]|uniref:site-specific DNA-methyltransferase (adenine-specific) n=3 Tax=Acidithiobacillus thiooxidans TaxID=930 RepID=A0A5P9XT74_ACITH|nr:MULTISPECIES: type I restriction-modification system subunit M [Acidithiobacillus]MBU2743400.1 type I restriction-modification system subunit M [Acidithiobacillus albertensis]MBU2812347.1 type I restriction-modification system subunit M [Acidithiobacillus thiooxidans]MBU2837759.1 type I restriction-modification system subunit M [Acidithiobacillus thiooxidans]MDA8151452.1 type I restriction-modification system subunit M [Acidithiobacillus sp.]MDA8176225.1 type I restriction-modification syst
MTEIDQKQLGNTLWGIADQLRGAMNADDFRDYMLSFLFLRYLSDNYEMAAAKELGPDYPRLEAGDRRTPLALWYAHNPEDIDAFETQMRRKIHYVIRPEYLWGSISELARTQNAELLHKLQKGFDYIENESFASTFNGLFSEINLNSEKLGKDYSARNQQLCTVIQAIAAGLSQFSTNQDVLGDAYEYLIGQFAAGSGKKAGEFYTPQQISSILSGIVTLDSQDPATGKKKQLDSVLDFACGSGSLLLNVRHRMGSHGIGKIYGQEKNITTYNLARMNMLLHGVKDSEFEIYHGDTLANDWDYLREANPAKAPQFDAVVANPPFSYRWEPNSALSEDMRFKNYGLAPKSAADFAFLLHGFHYLKPEGVMAIILPHGVLFRGGAEERIRTKLLKDGNIDTVIGLPANLFFSTGIPVCILVLKKCKKPDDVLFINAAEHFEKGKRQNRLRPEDIDKIIDTYQFRREEERYARRVPMTEIADNDYNLNISRYISTATPEEEIDLQAVHQQLATLEDQIAEATQRHNAFLQELGLPLLGRHH